MGEISSTNLILVTNIAPQATKDQMNTLFGHVGRVEELKLYPSVRDANVSVDSRCCFIRFSEPSCVPITKHLNNTVFIDRAIIVTPVIDKVIPDEAIGLILSQRVQTQQQNSGGSGVVGVKGQTGEVEGPATAMSAGTADAGEFQDPRLEAAGLPPYPALPLDTRAHLVNEIRRTVVVINIDSTVSAQQCMEFFSEAGEVKFFRYCTRENDATKYALIEFSERSSVVPALLMSGRPLGTSIIQVTHSMEAIVKPQAKSNEAAQREIEEAIVKHQSETSSLVSAAVDPIMGIIGGVSARSSRTRSRSRSRSRRRSRSRGRSTFSSRRSRSRDRDRDRRRRSRSKERRRRSRSRDRHRRSRSRSRERRRRSRSRDRHRRTRSKSRDRRDRDRDRDRDKDRDKDKKNKKEEAPKTEVAKKEEAPKTEVVKKEEAPKTEVAKKDEKVPEENKEEGAKVQEGSEKKDRSDKDKDRDRDRERDKDRDKRRRRSRSRDRRRRSRSRDRDRRRRSRSRDRKRSRSRDRSKKTKESTEVKRDYDQEEKGFEEKAKSPPKETVNTEAQDMDISNSP